MSERRGATSKCALRSSPSPSRDRSRRPPPEPPSARGCDGTGVAATASTAEAPICTYGIDQCSPSQNRCRRRRADDRHRERERARAPRPAMRRAIAAVPAIMGDSHGIGQAVAVEPLSHARVQRRTERPRRACQARRSIDRDHEAGDRRQRPPGACRRPCPPRASGRNCATGVQCIEYRTSGASSHPFCTKELNKTSSSSEPSRAGKLGWRIEKALRTNSANSGDTHLRSQSGIAGSAAQSQSEVNGVLPRPAAWDD